MSTCPTERDHPGSSCCTFFQVSALNFQFSSGSTDREFSEEIIERPRVFYSRLENLICLAKEFNHSDFFFFLSLIIHTFIILKNEFICKIVYSTFIIICSTLFKISFI